MKLQLPYIFLFALLACGSKIKNSHETSAYNFTSPDKRIVLPDTLREISGLTFIDDSTFACIQDENGILFIYDIRQNSIRHQYTFHTDGDYEGITRVGKNMYVLQSDGTLFEISDYTSAQFDLKSYNTQVPANNNEGLCYDQKNNRLLIGCKGKIGKGPEFKDKRVVYGFDLTTKKISEEPVYDFDMEAIKKRAIEKKLDLRTRSKKKGDLQDPIIKLATSAICIHPITGELYLLSATDHMLFVFEAGGRIADIEQLDTHLFNKAEGITFFENGDALITNEGQDKKPTLLRFNYRKS